MLLTMLLTWQQYQQFPSTCFDRLPFVTPPNLFVYNYSLFGSSSRAACGHGVLFSLDMSLNGECGESLAQAKSVFILEKESKGSFKETPAQAYGDTMPDPRKIESTLAPTEGLSK